MLLLAYESTGCSKAAGQYFRPIESVKDSQVVIYLYRPPGQIGHAYSYPIFANGNFVTKLGDGGYFPYVSTLGAITFSLSKEGKGIMVTLVARRDETHFVKLYLKEKFNPFKASGDLIMEEVSEKVAFEEIRDCRLME